MSDQCTVLVVDDDGAHRTMLRTLISGWGYSVSEADDGAAAIESVKKTAYDLVLMDVRMVKVSGLEALEKIKSYNPAIPVIIMTAYSSVETAVEALKQGAHDYLTKPLDFDKLRLTLERAMEHTRLKAENRMLRESLGRQFDSQNIIGKSPAMIRLLETVAQVAPSEATVLISGESGTGKELIARSIHYHSHRSGGPRVKISCGALPDELLESEVFGFQKGAFTGAHRNKPGRLELAHDGTLFIDEIGDLSLPLQAKFLQVLEDKAFARLGGTYDRAVDTRVVAATNADLQKKVKGGGFRKDLFYRLNVIHTKAPALRERKQDLPLLIHFFLNKYSLELKKDLLELPARVAKHLSAYHWPGNVRELENAVRRAVALRDWGFVFREMVIDTVNPAGRNADVERVMPFPAWEDEKIRKLIREQGFSLKKVSGLYVSEAEKSTILEVLGKTQWNRKRAAEILGVSYKTLLTRIDSFGLKPSV